MAQYLQQVATHRNAREKQSVTDLWRSTSISSLEIKVRRKAAEAAKVQEEKARSTGLLERTKKAFTVKDEFTELKTHKGFFSSLLHRISGISLPLFILFFIFLSCVFVVFVALYIEELIAITAILAVAGALMIGFPSILKLSSLAREIRQIRSGKTPVFPADSLHSVRIINTHDDLEFVSRLIELGSRELSLVRVAQSHTQSLEVKQALFSSRVSSVLLTGSIVLPVFFSMAILWFRGAVGLLPLGLCSLLAFWILITYKVEYRLRLHRLRLIQKDRDRMAGQISSLLDADEYENRELPPDFGLYLRAFMTTDKLPIRKFDLETMLAYSIAPTLPLLALGKPGEHLGSGRIQTTNEHWQEEILRLMASARLILIIPSHRTGTLWEIQTLRERGLFEKTIFIMPPELPFHGGRYSDDWKITVAAARNVGVQFPDHVHVGMLFRLDQDGALENFAPLLSEQFLQEITLLGYSADIMPLMADSSDMSDQDHGGGYNEIQADQGDVGARPSSGEIHLRHDSGGDSGGQGHSGDHGGSAGDGHAHSGDYSSGDGYS